MSSYWCSKICHLHLRVLKFSFDWNWFWRKIYLHDCGEECFIFAQKTVLNKNRLRRLWKYYPSQHVQTFPFNKFVRVVRNLAPWFWYNCMHVLVQKPHRPDIAVTLPLLCLSIKSKMVNHSKAMFWNISTSSFLFGKIRIDRHCESDANLRVDVSK